jgi:hypothetical protein
MVNGNTDKNFKDASPRSIPGVGATGRTAPSAAPPLGEGSDLVSRGSRPSLCERCYGPFSRWRHPDDYYRTADTCLSCGADLHWEQGRAVARDYTDFPSTYAPSWETRASSRDFGSGYSVVSSTGKHLYDIRLFENEDGEQEPWEPADVRWEDWHPIIVNYLSRTGTENFDRVRKTYTERIIAWWKLSGDFGLVLRPPEKPHRREIERQRNRERTRAWDDVVDELRAQGYSWRKIEAITGIHHNTARDRFVAPSGRIAPKGMDTHSAPTVDDRLAAVEAGLRDVKDAVRDHGQQLAENKALIRDYAERLADVEELRGLPPGGIKAAVEGLDAFLASIGQEREPE